MKGMKTLKKLLFSKRSQRKTARTGMTLSLNSEGILLGPTRAGKEEFYDPLLPSSCSHDDLVELEAQAFAGWDLKRSSAPGALETDEEATLDASDATNSICADRTLRSSSLSSYSVAINRLVAAIAAGFLFFVYHSQSRGYPSGCLVASGPIVRGELDVSLFSKLQVHLPGKVIITQGEKQQVVVESHANVLDRLDTSVLNGEWKVGLQRNGCARKLKQLTVHIQTPDLDSIISVGSGDVEATFEATESKTKTISLVGSGNMKISYKNLNVLNTKLLGSGTLTLEGDAQVHNLRTMGSGDVKAFHLLTQHADVGLIGSGDAEVRVDQSLEVTMLGNGGVRYVGNPKVTQSGFGSSEVEKVMG